MLLQTETTYTYDGSDGLFNYPADWFPINVAGYDTIAITISSAAGWDGDISFWGGAGADQSSDGLWALNTADNASLTAVVTNIVGATPTAFAKNYRGSIAGLSEFGIYFANPTNFESVVGTVTVEVGLYTSAK
tara:strand:+ start:178 stop:576 length:399 start_codon:yes stop_codon:yes gene_type:complete